MREKERESEKKYVREKKEAYVPIIETHIFSSYCECVHVAFPIYVYHSYIYNHLCRYM